MMHCQFSGSNLRTEKDFKLSKENAYYIGRLPVCSRFIFYIKSTVNIDKTYCQCKKPTNTSFICNLVGFSCRLLSQTCFIDILNLHFVTLW